jgi:hypothetical protein
MMVVIVFTIQPFSSKLGRRVNVLNPEKINSMKNVIEGVPKVIWCKCGFAGKTAFSLRGSFFSWQF